MSWSKMGFCCDCQCDIWLEPFCGGWAGTCPNCGCFKTYGELHCEPDPEDMDLWAERNFKSVEPEGRQIRDGKTVYFYRVVN